jgi:hypothetical protein
LGLAIETAAKESNDTLFKTRQVVSKQRNKLKDFATKEEVAIRRRIFLAGKDGYPGKENQGYTNKKNLHKMARDLRIMDGMMFGTMVPKMIHQKSVTLTDEARATQEEVGRLHRILENHCQGDDDTMDYNNGGRTGIDN